MILENEITLFRELYNEEIISISWDREDLGFRVARSHSDDLRDSLDKKTINRFMKIINEIIDYVSDESYEETETFIQLKNGMGDDFEKIIEEAEWQVLLVEPTLEELNVEFLTKRSYRDVKKVLGYNVKLKFSLDSDQEITFELEEQQLKKLTDALLSSQEKLNQIKNS